MLDSYGKFHKKLTTEAPELTPPKLVICGHGSVDDPDGTCIYDEVLDYLEKKVPDLRHMICVVRLRPVDQVLNALLSKATVALQLSRFEGFEVKVSEAIHKGKPIIATRAGGIPLQIKNGKNGFLVNVGDTDAVAQHLFNLWTDNEMYKRMSEYGIKYISDEVSTVGHGLDWLYIASKFSRGERVRPHERWITDMAFEELGIPQGDEPRLTREVELERMG